MSRLNEKENFYLWLLGRGKPVFHLYKVLIRYPYEVVNPFLAEEKELVFPGLLLFYQFTIGGYYQMGWGFNFNLIGGEIRKELAISVILVAYPFSVVKENPGFGKPLGYEIIPDARTGAGKGLGQFGDKFHLNGELIPGFCRLRKGDFRHGSVLCIPVIGLDELKGARQVLSVYRYPFDFFLSPPFFVFFPFAGKTSDFLHKGRALPEGVLVKMKGNPIHRDLSVVFPLNNFPSLYENLIPSLYLQGHFHFIGCDPGK